MMKDDRGSLELCRAIIDASPDCVKVLGPDGALLFMNESGLCLMEIEDFGLVEGKDWPSLWPEAQQPDVRRSLQACMAGGISRFQGFCPTAKGTPKTWDVMLSPMLDAEGQIATIVAISRDVTQLRATETALRAAERRSQAIIDHSPDLIIRAAPDGRIRYASPASRWLGFAPGELVGVQKLDLVHPDDREAFAAHRAALLKGEPPGGQREFRFLHKSDGWRWVEGSPVVIRGADGQVQETFNVFRDVTSRRMAQDQAQELSRRASLAEAVAGIGYWTLDPASLAISWSDQMYAIYGLEPQATPDLNGAMALVHEDDIAASRARLQAALKGAGWTESLARIVRPDGELRYLAGSAVCEFGPDGRVVEVLGTVRDVTERSKAGLALADSEERYRLIAENATDMIWQFDPEGVISFVSPSSLSVLGYASEELLGRRVMDFVHPEDLPIQMDLFAKALSAGPSGSSRRVQFRAIRKDGQCIWLEGQPRLTFDPHTGQASGAQDVIRDISERKQAELELVEARASAETASRVKTDFLANMSHEIRTPLTAVLGFSSLLSDNPNLDQEALAQVGRITSASAALLAIVNDILDFSKLEAAELALKPRPASPASCLREAVEMFSQQAHAKGLELDLVLADDAPEFVLLDPDRLRQILLNLVGNAVKFTESGRVQVELGFDHPRDVLRVRVIDSGSGLEEEQVRRLFRRFSQVDASSTRKHGGTGLGLAICKGLVEAMGGSIRAESTVGQGSVFSFEIVAPVVDPPAPAADAASPSLTGVRVLVVDDNAANREIGRAILESAGAEVSEACSGGAAISMAATTPFDVILMDLRMPGMNGVEAVAFIRSAPGPNQDIPILAFSANSHEQAAPSGDFDGVIAKPMVARDMVQAIHQWSVAPAAQEGIADEAA